MREATIRQGATDVRSAGPRGRAGRGERSRPSGERGGNGRLKRKKWATARPKGRMGRLAAGRIGLKVRKKFFSE
jgi:hypothetical protein